MNEFGQNLLRLEEPQNYFKGRGSAVIPTPCNVLLFLRSTREQLQQEALQNRSHHRFVLIFNLETEGQVQLDSLSLPLKPGQALLVLPYQFHHFSLLASTRLRWLFCTFDLEPQAYLEPLRNRVVDMGKRTRSNLEDLLEEWHALSGERHPEQLQVTLLRLLVSLTQDRQQPGADLPTEPDNNLVRNINRLMAEWRGRTVVTADIAEKLRISESRLRILFKESAGIPLGRYIQNYRLNRAMALLRTGSLPIAVIAEEAGFGSPQAFSRIFKHKTGKTPRAYRKET